MRPYSDPGRFTGPGLTSLAEMPFGAKPLVLSRVLSLPKGLSKDDRGGGRGGTASPGRGLNPQPHPGRITMRPYSDPEKLTDPGLTSLKYGSGRSRSP